MARRKGIRFIFNAAIFIILEIAALAMLRHSGVMQNLWISRGFHAVSASVWGSLQDFRYYFSLRQKNDELAKENFALTQQIRRYRLLTGKDLSDTVRTPADTAGEYRYMPAEIVDHRQRLRRRRRGEIRHHHQRGRGRHHRCRQQALFLRPVFPEFRHKHKCKNRKGRHRGTDEMGRTQQQRGDPK